jgi:hypothetical protein
MYMQLKGYGQKGLIARFKAYFRALNRKGYLCLNMSQGLAKDLRTRGMLI